ncbi:AAA ATPase domain/RecF/RecN/SMC N terminal domain/AAA domain/AAA domain, putative AbiEii toxin, Type IV TA system, putative [Angomonas deanei]|uniref:AAA ATPase domain/RecF/RecN/SMC N terminal domain/AAA domain/AAA domain, putative AbiEii toxin, Type IV TA system, putative n=1 Tax=Angomonas deanei TaxID=59799 RepID=A0A7G2CPN4_9TRYP|nr:AAA ATPase domain/RecF/RecN/SMC N terminal domain/AAA domain/AAA domain, putative AbiEii toxin, Type IV TA system, putative [Angomonas deanei]
MAKKAQKKNQKKVKREPVEQEEVEEEPTVVKTEDTRPSQPVEEEPQQEQSPSEDEERASSPKASSESDADSPGTFEEKEWIPSQGAQEAEEKAQRADPDEVVTRLVIKDIDVENFKSYYGRHKIGPFHKTFTAVIGPNGSGKSNVIDSMLFVFGRNAKKIRLEKLSELIHSSAAHPDVSYASVTVNFVRVFETQHDATDPMFRKEVPNSALSVKREVFRSGVSQYSIDGQRRTQKEVVEHLIKEGIDLEHNRFLILQGEVEQIALMKPKAEKEGEEGLLEYLDDLIGTNEYVGRVSDLTSAAEQAQTERLESLDKEKKLRAERDALDDAKNSTIAFVTKDNQLQKTLIAMCQLRMRGD